jgi:hypothetical protein
MFLRAATTVLPFIAAARNFTAFVSFASVVNALKAFAWSVTIWETLRRQQTHFQASHDKVKAFRDSLAVSK